MKKGIISKNINIENNFFPNKENTHLQLNKGNNIVESKSKRIAKLKDKITKLGEKIRELKYGEEYQKIKEEYENKIILLRIKNNQAVENLEKEQTKLLTELVTLKKQKKERNGFK